MRSAFSAYYAYSDEQTRELWNNATVVMDTSTLLNLYRYSPATREDFVKTLEKLKSQVWMPHQVGLEFHRGRIGVIATQKDAFAELTKALAQIRKDVRAAANTIRRHRSSHAEAIEQAVEEGMISAEKIIAEAQNDKKQQISADSDAILDALTDVYEGRVGNAFEPDRMAEVRKEGSIRFAEQIPPGYKDSDKSDDKRYGDYIIWLQIMERAAATSSPIIFVTDDTKDDWWRVENRRIVGPRIELIDELESVAQVALLMYTPSRFLEYASRYGVATKLNERSVGEAQEISAEAEPRVRITEFTDSMRKDQTGRDDAASRLRGLEERRDDLISGSLRAQVEAEIAREQIDSVSARLDVVDEYLFHVESALDEVDDDQAKLLQSQRDQILADHKRLVGELKLARSVEQQQLRGREQIAQLDRAITDAREEVGRHEAALDRLRSLGFHRRLSE